MRDFHIQLIGNSPLLMHHDDVSWADTMEEWKNNPENKKRSKAGDDRSPAFRWVGYCYHDGERLVMPVDNVMATAREGGALVPVPGGRSGKTFKAQSQSGIVPADPFWPILVGGKEIPWAPISALIQEPDFKQHLAVARDLGFELHVKRARVGTSKHIRVRPIFHTWECAGVVSVIDEQITDKALKDIFDYAGQYKGIGDWRPSSPSKPGTFGRFSVEVKRI